MREKEPVKETVQSVEEADVVDRTECVNDSEQRSVEKKSQPLKQKPKVVAQEVPPLDVSEIEK